MPSTGRVRGPVVDEGDMGRLDAKIDGVKELAAAENARLCEMIQGLERLVTANERARDLAQQKFEATVERDSVKQNEFRGALNDLGQQMATRRELETATGAQEHINEELRLRVGELRSRIDVGPPAIPGIQDRLSTDIGRREGGQQLAKAIYAAIGAVAAVIGVSLALVAYNASRSNTPTPTITVTVPSSIP